MAAASDAADDRARSAIKPCSRYTAQSVLRSMTSRHREYVALVKKLNRPGVSATDVRQQLLDEFPDPSKASQDLISDLKQQKIHK